MFGATVEELNAIKDDYDPVAIYEASPRLKRVIDTLGDGTFEPAPEPAPAPEAVDGEEAAEAGEFDVPMEEGQLCELRKALLAGASWHKPDHYFLLKDYESYMAAKLKAIRATADELAFAKQCLHNIAGAGKFSSDRNIEEYWKELWAK